MQLSLTRALGIVKQAKLGEDPFALVCSFEPLHLKTFLQAHLATAVPERTPTVMTFGYDQLRQGLEYTSATHPSAPVLLALQWDDIHPALSWRTRSEFSVTHAELETQREQFLGLLDHWMKRRNASTTYVAMPSRLWLPQFDSQPAPFLGPIRGRVEQIAAEAAELLASREARVLRIDEMQLDFRSLLSAGSPLYTADAEWLARIVVETAYVPRQRLKAIIVDLDNTLWKGVIGEDGPQGILCAPHAEGFGFLTWQKFLKKLRSDGVMLGFCTKNNADDVIPVFDSLKFPLRLSDFASYRCNWQPKPQNIKEIVGELNIGLDAVLYVDDNEAELEQIRAAIPELQVLKTPESLSDWHSLFQTIHGRAATFHVSAEDRLRTEQIQRNADRKSAFETMEGAAHLRSLSLQLNIVPNGFETPRALELINKTNQFNMTGQRISESRWAELTGMPEWVCYTASLEDKFGEFGIISVLSGYVMGRELVVDSFVLSCRAFGRCVEQIFMAEIAQALSVVSVRGLYRQTGKNEPSARFLAEIGVEWLSDEEWKIDSGKLRACADKLIQEAGVSVEVGQTLTQGGD